MVILHSLVCSLQSRNQDGMMLVFVPSAPQSHLNYFDSCYNMFTSADRFIEGNRTAISTEISL